LLIILTQTQIVEKVGSQAAAAFAELYTEFLPRVFRYISYRIADEPTTEDLTSLVFEKALAKFNSYRPDKASFSTWIFTIARNTLTDYYRTGHKEQTVGLEEAVGVAAPDPSPEEESECAEDRQILNSCLAQLSRGEQEIISLKFGAEMTNRQIARTLSLTESNVGIIIYRAVRKLRDNFREKQNG
jgi:RNA polymerase sigma factor (sigma-70 family)